MVEGVNDTGPRLEALETKLDELSVSVDKRFDAVDGAIVEQRQYTDFAFEKLERAMSAKFDVVNTDLAGVKTDLAGVKTDLAGVKTDLAGVKADVGILRSGLGRIERKLDQLIDRGPQA